MIFKILLAELSHSVQFVAVSLHCLQLSSHFSGFQQSCLTPSLLVGFLVAHSGSFLSLGGYVTLGGIKKPSIGSHFPCLTSLSFNLASDWFLILDLDQVHSTQPSSEPLIQVLQDL